VAKSKPGSFLGGSFAPLIEGLKGNNYRVAGAYKQVMHDESWVLGTDVVKFFKMPSVKAKVIK